MDIIKQIESLGLLRGGRALDLGAGDCAFSNILVNKGYEVLAIDKDISKCKSVGIVQDTLNLIEQNILDFDFSDQRFDLIFARNVLPFISKKSLVVGLIKRCVKHLSNGGLLFLTLFGHNDEWSSRADMSFFDYKESINIFRDMSVEMIHRSTEESLRSTMAGKVKYCHIHKFLIQKI